MTSVEQLIDGCVDIANEVGTAKIGDPYDLFIHNNEEKALYAVESWYSWHSREDYRNNTILFAMLITEHVQGLLASYLSQKQ